MSAAPGPGGERVRLALAGAGHMGRLHAEKALRLREQGWPLEIVGVHDVDSARAGLLAAELRVSAFPDAASLYSAADAVVVAVSTGAHYEVARAVLDAGCDLLVEKPIALRLEDAEDLRKRAEARGRVLQVGHQEWHNPALRAIRERIERPRFVEVHRLGPFAERAADVDVVRDLMIHDLDILQQLLGEEPSRVEAVGVPVLSAQIDIANARLTYPGGCVANLTASRVTPTPMRKLRLFQRDGYVSVDFLEPGALVLRREPVAGAGPAEAEIQVERLEVDPDDALLAQLRAFLDALRSRQPLAEGGPGSVAAASRALRTALRVIEAMPELDEDS